jgi:Protein of unknown function (DUF4089)
LGPEVDHRLDGAACLVQIGGVMSSEPFDPEALIEAVAPLLGLTLGPESRAQTALHLRIAAQQAEKLLSIALDDAEEPAPVFTA